MRALVVYGSKNGGTQGLAEMVGGSLHDLGWDVTVRSGARRDDDVRSYDLVVVGGSLYALRWNKDALRFLKRETKTLRTKPVWLFSSGPLGQDAARASTVPPTKQVAQLMAQVGAKGHRTFGGRLEPDAKGFMAKAMAKKMAGDWRDPQQVRDWVGEIVTALPD